MGIVLLVLFLLPFYPLDFAFVYPTEIVVFNYIEGNEFHDVTVMLLSLQWILCLNKVTNKQITWVMGTLHSCEI